MIIEYDVHCHERTLTIKWDDHYECLRDEILEMLDDYYSEWQDATDPFITDTPLEEYMMDRLSETYNMWEEWESIPYGDDYEPRETLWVCDHCLAAITSHEGNQATLTHYVDEYDAVESKCDWCKSCGHDKLYELI